MSQKDENTVENTVREAPRGGLLKTGNPGNKGGTGRPPNEFRARMQRLVTKKSTETYLKRCLAGDFGPRNYIAALHYATDHGYGKPAQPIVGDATQPLTFRIMRE